MCLPSLFVFSICALEVSGFRITHVDAIRAGLASYLFVMSPLILVGLLLQIRFQVSTSEIVNIVKTTFLSDFSHTSLHTVKLKHLTGGRKINTVLT